MRFKICSQLSAHYSEIPLRHHHSHRLIHLLLHHRHRLILPSFLPLADSATGPFAPSSSAESVDDEQSLAVVFKYELKDGDAIYENGKLYYYNSDGENVEFEFNSEEYKALNDKYSNDPKLGLTDAERRKFFAMREYFADTIKNNYYGKDLTELSGDNPVPTTVSEEEFNNIQQKIRNGIIPSDYELAQLKVYEQTATYYYYLGNKPSTFIDYLVGT